MGLYDDTVHKKESTSKVQNNPALLELEFGLELSEGVVYVLDEIEVDTTLLKSGGEAFDNVGKHIEKIELK